MNYKIHRPLTKSASRYGMEISHEKSKICVNDPDPNKDNSNNLIINMYGKYFRKIIIAKNK